MNATKLSNVLVPVAPEIQQSLISAQIGNLFSEIDNGERGLAEARAGVETYRKALLKAAVTGELTADWRRENPTTETGEHLLRRILTARRSKWEADPKNRGKRYVEPAAANTDELPDLPDGWCWTNLGRLFSIAVGTTPSRGTREHWQGDLPWVSSGEVAFCRISQTRETISRFGVSPERVHPPGTVLLGMIGEGKTRGQTAILETYAAHNQNCASISVSETPVPSEYIYWFLEKSYNATRNDSAGGNQPALNKDKVSAICFPLPPLAELKAICAELRAGFDLIEGVMPDFADARRQAATFRQSILAAAFRGDLAV